MQRRPHRSYSTEFKLSVVQAYMNSEGGLKAVARQFGPCHPVLIKWVLVLCSGREPTVL